MPGLPNADRCVIPAVKLTGYLLSKNHEDGAPKAAFFEGFGFRRRDWRALREAIRQHAKDCQVASSRPTPFGQMFEVNGRLSSPDGRNPVVLIVWIIPNGDDRPRLVTAVPSEEDQ